MAGLLCGVVRKTTIETQDPVIAACCAISEAAQAAITFNSASFPTCYGLEYISGKLLIWAEKRGITIQHIQPGQPRQNIRIKRQNRTVRHEWPDQYIIETIEGGQDHATQWLWTYNNNDRPNIPFMVCGPTIAGQRGSGGITAAMKLKMVA